MAEQSNGNGESRAPAERSECDTLVVTIQIAALKVCGFATTRFFAVLHQTMKLPSLGAGWITPERYGKVSRNLTRH
jgi:hypothetical protein